VIDAVETIVVAPRGGVTQGDVDEALAALTAARRAKVLMLDDLPLVDESATSIRARLRAHASVRYLVPEPVYRYIAEHGLYAQ
jgi:nicotinamide mononucleotide adenylyltransferase